MAQGDLPDSFPMVDDKSIPTLPWVQWFQRLQNLAVALYGSGTTAQRPTKRLWVGRFYFDTTLGKPVWVKDPLPTPAVWVDATGTPV